MKIVDSLGDFSTTRPKGKSQSNRTTPNSKCYLSVIAMKNEGADQIGAELDASQNLRGRKGTRLGTIRRDEE